MNSLYFGGPVDGGTFPADIWGDYMGRIKGSFCGDFAPPKTPFAPRRSTAGTPSRAAR